MKITILNYNRIIINRIMKKRVIKKKTEKREPITFKISYHKGSANIIVREEDYYAKNIESKKLKCKTYVYK